MKLKMKTFMFIFMCILLVPSLSFAASYRGSVTFWNGGYTNLGSNVTLWSYHDIEYDSEEDCWRFAYAEYGSWIQVRLYVTTWDDEYSYVNIDHWTGDCGLSHYKSTVNIIINGKPICYVLNPGGHSWLQEEDHLNISKYLKAGYNYFWIKNWKMNCKYHIQDVDFYW